MASPTFLVLGGSRYQLPYIEAASRLGCRTLCFDMNADPPGKNAADGFVQCDTSDVERATKLAAQFNVSGVLAPATDIAVLTKARIDEALGLHGPSITAASVLTDKNAFRKWRDREFQPGPVWIEMDAGKCPDRLPMPAPFIVKPNRSSGGRGARKIRTLPDLQEAWAGWDEPMRRHGAIAESWIEGAELSFEGFLRDGQFWLAVVTARKTAASPFVATTGHDWPAALDNAAAKSVLDTVASVCEKLGISDGPVDADLILAGKPELLELSPRPGGNCLTQLVSAVFDIDYPALAVRSALGEKPAGKAPEKVASAAAVEILHAATPAKVFHNAGSTKRPPLVNGVKWLELDVASGSQVPAFHSGRDRVGAILATAETRAEARAAIGAQLAALDWRIESEAAT